MEFFVECKVEVYFFGKTLERNSIVKHENFFLKKWVWNDLGKYYGWFITQRAGIERRPRNLDFCGVPPVAASSEDF